jgi:hypothetical protein
VDFIQQIEAQLVVTPEDPNEALEDKAWKLIADARKSKAEAAEVQREMCYLLY